MTAEISPQLRKGVVEFCILGALAGEPKYGWELSEELSAVGLIGSIGTLYPVLTRLRERGLISAFERASEAGPVRKYYRLTSDGLRELADFRTQFTAFTHAVNAMTQGDNNE